MKWATKENPFGHLQVKESVATKVFLSLQLLKNHLFIIRIWGLCRKDLTTVKIMTFFTMSEWLCEILKNVLICFSTVS